MKPPRIMLSVTRDVTLAPPTAPAGVVRNAVSVVRSRRLHDSARPFAQTARFHGLRLGPIEHRVKKIALDNSNNHFAYDLANFHVSQPCLKG